MHDFRPILLILGILISTLAVAMLLPAMADLAVGNPDWEVFAMSSGFTLFIGAMLILTNRIGATRLVSRQAFLLTTLSWIALPTFGFAQDDSERPNSEDLLPETTVLYVQIEILL